MLAEDTIPKSRIPKWLFNGIQMQETKKPVAKENKPVQYTSFRWISSADVSLVT